MFCTQCGAELKSDQEFCESCGAKVASKQESTETKVSNETKAPTNISTTYQRMSLQKAREFLLREKLLSFRDKVRVMTPDQQELGYFKGKIIKIGNTYRLWDLQDESNALLTVHEKIISLRSSYTFYKGGEKRDDKFIGKMKRKLVSIRPKYWFENPNEERIITMKGNIWALKFSIQKDGKDIAWVNQKLFRIRGTYGVKMDPDLDDDTAMLVLGIVVMLHHEKEEAQSSSSGINF